MYAVNYLYIRIQGPIKGVRDTEVHTCIYRNILKCIYIGTHLIIML